MINEKFISVIWLLPLVFMFHDFEEIIFIEWWKHKNKDILVNKYPRIFKVYSDLSTPSFALAVSEEFIIIILITLLSVIFKFYYLWYATLIGFLLHLIVHVIQWLAYGKYIPAIVTTIPSIVYCVYAMLYIYNSNNMELFKVAIWGVLGIILVSINLIFAHKLARNFNKFIKA